MVIGFRPVLEALRSGKDLDKVLIQKGLQGELFREVRQALQDAEIPYQLVPGEKLNALSRANHQGIIAFYASTSFGNLDEVVQRTFESGVDPCILMLDGVTDVRNFGAACRSAEGLGAHAVVIPEKGSARVNEEAVKSSAGALLHLPVCREKSLAAAVKRLQNSGIRVAACTEKAADLIFKTDVSGPVCLIMGSEETGIAPDLLKIADVLVKIPMTGKTSSLNVSVAAGIILYEVARQRTNDINE